ncbi:hypothetical protein L2E82_05076 [Cichorium intybus]|uniref:Uncharacterized protein n=1 Tax=Cichorium intybus TaxID=13427 RepID=A0ACB9H6G9_CICIN|nr:hypothetical protein L2E82_05076 [Cichorium intybus]
MHLESYQDHAYYGQVYTDDHIYLINVYGLCEYAAPSLYAKSLHFAMIGNSFLELCILSLIKIILADPFSKSNPLAYFENLNILSCEMPAGKSRAHIPLYWHILCESLLVFRYSGIASEITFLIRFRLVMRFGRTLQDPGPLMFCGSRTSFEVLELFKDSIQSLILISEICNLQLTLSQLIPKSYPLDLWVIHFLPHVLYKELNHHLTLSQMIPKSCPTGSLVDSFLNTLRTQFIM